jgi:uncharacterized protein
MDWDALGGRLSEMRDQIIADSFQPGAIVGISRGGLIPATYFANTLNVPDFHVLGIARNISNESFSVKQEPELLWAAPIGNLQGACLLLVDDVVCEGKTMSLATGILRERGAIEIRTAVIARNHTSRFKPNYCGLVAEGWIVFPWEALHENDQDKRKHAR